MKTNNKSYQSKMKISAKATALAFVGLLISLLGIAIIGQGIVLQVILYACATLLLISAAELIIIHLKEYWRGNGFFFNSFLISAAAFFIVFGGSLVVYSFFKQLGNPISILKTIYEVSAVITVSCGVISLLGCRLEDKYEQRKNERYAFQSPTEF